MYDRGIRGGAFSIRPLWAYEITFFEILEVNGMLRHTFWTLEGQNICYQFHLKQVVSYPPASEASRELENFNWRKKNTPTRLYWGRKICSKSPIFNLVHLSGLCSNLELFW